MADAKTATKEHEHAAQHQSQPEAPPPAPVVAAAPSQAPVIAAPAPTGPVLAASAMQPRLLNETRFYGREFRQAEWLVIAEKGTTIEDLNRKEFWANVAQKLREPDKICVIAEDRSFYAEFVVFVAAHNWALVRPFGEPVYLEKAQFPAPEEDYEIQDDGLQNRWIVVEKRTGRVIKGDGTLMTRQAAENWRRQWLQATRNPRAA